MTTPTEFVLWLNGAVGATAMAVNYAKEAK